MGRTFLAIWIVSLTFFLIFSSGARATPEFDRTPIGGEELDFGPIRFGRVEVHPGIGFKTQYNDNIFLEANKRFFNGTSESKESDIIFTVLPALDVELERGPGELFGIFFRYQGEDEHYLDFSDTQDTFNHYAAGMINLGSPGGRGDFTIGTIYEKSRNAGNRDIQTNLGNRVQIQRHTHFLDLIYSHSENLDFLIDVDFKREQYGAQFSLQNVQIYDVGGSVVWQATDPMSYGFKYNRRIRDYKTVSPNNDNSNEDQVSLAFKWEPTTLFTSEFSLGVDSIRFQNFSNQDDLNLIYHLDLSYHPRERTKFYLRSDRQVLDSTFDTVQFILYTNVGLGLIQKLGNKFLLEIGGLFENLNYKNPTIDFVGGGEVEVRQDKIFKGTMTLAYQIKWWLQAKVQYSYQENRSNFNNFEFINNLGLFEISVKY